MRKQLQQIQGLIDGLNERLGGIAAWLLLLLALAQFAVALLRYGLDFGSNALSESVGWLHLWILVLGMAYTLKQDDHVRVDILYQKMSPRARAWVNLGGVLLLLLPCCGFLLYLSWDYVAFSWLMREGSSDPGGLPGVYLLKSGLLLMSACLILQGLALACRSLLQLTGPEQD